MPDIEATIEDIRTSSSAAHDVAEGVRVIHLGALSEAGAAMPGARVAGLFGRVERLLGEQISEVAAGFATLGDGMRDAADLYQTNEDAAVEALTGGPSGSSASRPV